MRLTAFLCAFVAVTGCVCGDGLESLEPDIAVEPLAIDFARAVVGRPTDARLQIGNRGTGRLTLEARVEPADAGFAITAPADVARGLAEDATVTFTPPGRGAFAADIVLLSNDPDTPALRVPVTGEGGPPAVTFDPDPVDLGLVNENDPRAQVVTVSNSGFDTLTITSVALQDGVGFALDAPVPPPLAPGASATLTVSLAPNAAIAAGADIERGIADRIVVTHLDGEDSVRVSARVNLAPVAVAVEDVTRRDVVKVSVGRVVLVDGSETADPEGDAFTYTWTLLERPAASAAALIGQGAPETRVTPDEVGRYVVNLRAVDVHGAVGEADLAILPRDLTVILTWSGADNDLDLHLVRPGGALGDYGVCPAACDALACNELTDDNLACRQEGTDCAFENRAPEWGAPGREDDPRLDIDDVSGGGPEIISVDVPEDGIWRAVVHHCADPLVEGGTATVRVLEEGVEVFASGPEALEQDDAWSAVTMTRASAGGQGAWESFIAGPGVVVTEPALCD